jgi:hypothetical protein
MRRVLIAAALSAALLTTADAKEQRGTIISIDDAAKTFVCQWGTKDWTYKTTKKTGIRISIGTAAGPTSRPARGSMSAITQSARTGWRTGSSSCGERASSRRFNYAPIDRIRSPGRPTWAGLGARACVNTAISSRETVDPPNRQTDAQENDEAQDSEPEHQIAYPAGRQFHSSLPSCRAEADFRNSATSTRTAKCPSAASAPAPNSSALLPTAERSSLRTRGARPACLRPRDRGDPGPFPPYLPMLPISKLPRRSANVGRQEVDRSHRTKMTNGAARVSGAWSEPKKKRDVTLESDAVLASAARFAAQGSITSPSQA